MIYLLHGEDDYTLQEALSSIIEEAAPGEVRDFNVTEFDGRDLSMDLLTATCDTVPFLSEKRLVVVRGLLALFERRASSRPRAGTSARQIKQPGLGDWQALPEYLPRVPETTVLVFVDGRLSGTNPLFSAIRPSATVRAFPVPGPGDVRRWIRSRAEAEGVSIEPRAIEALMETIGANLRVLATEIQKLSLYRWDETVRYEDVQELVSYTREANIFAAVDAVMESRPSVALRQIHQLLIAGRPAGYVISMLARQVRLLLLAKELKTMRVGAAQMAARLGLSGYPLRKTLEQEPKLSEQQLLAIHGKLLDADRITKTTGIPEDLALDLLITDVCLGHRTNQQR